MIILHIPHSSALIPEEDSNLILLSESELQRELLRMTDRFTDELFVSEGNKYHVIKFPISRLIVDPERFLDDSLESMTAVGMGVVYTKTSEGTLLKRTLSTQERKHLIELYYHPHHKTLYDVVSNSLNRHLVATIIDCHSFPSIPLPYENNQDKNRPDICIGTDLYHTPNWLAEAVHRLFREKGYTVEFDKPFGGTLVPMEYYKKDARVYSIMIEISRHLYMDENSGEKHSSFNIVKSDIADVLQLVNSIT